MLFRGLWKLATLPLYLLFVDIIPKTIQQCYRITGFIQWTLWGFLVWGFMKYGLNIPFPTLLPDNTFGLALYPAQILYLLSIGFGMNAISMYSKKHLVPFLFSVIGLQVIPFDALPLPMPEFYAVNSVHSAWFQVMFLGFALSSYANYPKVKWHWEKYMHKPIWNPWNIEKKVKALKATAPQPVKDNCVIIGRFSYGKKLKREHMQARLTPQLQMLMKKG